MTAPSVLCETIQMASALNRIYHFISLEQNDTDTSPKNLSALLFKGHIQANTVIQPQQIYNQIEGKRRRQLHFS
jgi:hypothetical protein